MQHKISIFKSSKINYNYLIKIYYIFYFPESRLDNLTFEINVLSKVYTVKRLNKPCLTPSLLALSY